MYFLRLSSISCPPLHADQSSPYLSGYAVNLPRNAQVLYSSKLICTLLLAGRPSVSCEQFQCNTCSLWSLQNCCKRNSITILVFFQWLLKWDFCYFILWEDPTSLELLNLSYTSDVPVLFTYSCTSSNG